MIKQNKGASWLVIFCLIFSMLNPFLKASENIILIRNAEDLAALARSCTLDSFSQGKEVKLVADIDVSGTEFTSIPTFGGTFDGAGHSITGVNIMLNGSVQGLFRYVQTTGLIKNLTVKGNVIPGGTKNQLGGIAGNNSGVIKACIFVGMIKGENEIGGIAGINEATGQIIDCTALGQASGTHYIGGIAGENLGTILRSKNKMEVNTSASEEEITLEDLEKINLKKLNDTENTTAITDVGGIAGFSSGIIQNCENFGTIGYQHIGYNIGGIAGRQSGYISSCSNHGEIYGRKDVGGIVGQLEPYMALDFSEDQVAKLRNELNKLKQILDQTTSDADSTSSDISGKLDETKAYVDEALDSTHTIMDQTQELYNDGVDSINNLSSRVTDTLEKLVPVLNDAKEMGAEAVLAIDQFMEVISSLEETTDTADEMLAKVKEETIKLQENMTDLTEVIEQIEKALDQLDDSIGDKKAVEVAIEELTQGLLDLSESVVEIGEGIKDISNAMTSLKKQIGENWEIVKKDITQVGNALIAIGKAIGQTAEHIKSASQDIKKGLEGVLPALLQIQMAANEIADEIDPSSMEGAVRELFRAMKNLAEEGEDSGIEWNEVKEIEKLGEEAVEEMEEVLDKTVTAVDTLQEVGNELNGITQKIYDIISDLARQPVTTFPNIDSSFINNAHELNNNLKDISDSLGSLKNSVTQKSELLIADIQKLSDQFYVVINLMIDQFSDSDDQKIDLSSYHQDVSDEDTASSTEGKVSQSVNAGEVQGDLNVGGIAGSMAIEYDFDPEDDVTKLGNSSLNFQYLTRAVLRGCINKGNITSKKNDAGGIVGRMDLGTVISCVAYGRIEGKDGSYVGGIAGSSESHITSSFSMCVLLGNNHVGGIAGYGNKLTNNYAMVEIEHSIECAGAIAGEVKNLQSQSGNFFVDRGVGAIDGISYDQKAGPISYEELKEVNNLPQEFTDLKITFKANENIVEVIPFEFGGSIQESDLPAIPEKEGCYGKWPEFDFDTLTFSATLEAVYTPYRSVVASNLTREGKAVALIEGSFDEDTVLNVAADNVYPEQGGDHAESWTVKLTAANLVESHCPLRLLKTQKGQASVYALESNGSWKKLSSKANGSYLTFTMEGSEQTFCIVYEDSRKAVWGIVGGIGIGIILLLIVLFKKKSRKNKTSFMTKE